MTIAKHVVAASVKAIIPQSNAAVTTYSQGFEGGSSVDGWTTSNGTVFAGTFGSPYAHTGTGCLEVNTATPGATTLSRTVTGLTVGLTYTLGMSIYSASTASLTALNIGVSGIGTTTPSGIGGGTRVNPTYTFVATATSHVIQANWSSTSSGSIAFVDDILVTQASYTSYNDYPLHVIDSSVTMDEYSVPYIQGSLTCSIPDLTTLDLVDPRNGLHVAVVLTTHQTGVADVTRTLKLVLTDRVLDFSDWTMTLSVASDEALLDNYALVATSSDRTYGLSVQTAVAYALSKIGATLAPGAADFTLPYDDPIVQRTNLVTDPQPAALASWSAGTNAGSATLSNTYAPPAGPLTTSFRVTASAAGTVNLNAGLSGTGGWPVAASTQYTFTVYARSSVARVCTPSVRWYTSAGAVIGSDVAGTAITSSTTAWTRYTVTATSPATAAFVFPYLSFASSTSGQFHYAANAQLEAAAAATSYFDGDTTDTATLDYQWTGTAHASASTENSKNSNATVWTPGTSAYDWVSPLVQTGNLRLWCDEAEVWHLDLSTTTNSTFVSVAAGSNVTGANETISLTSGEWYSAVVVEYNWDTSDGLSHTQYDIAGTPTNGRTLYQSYDSVPYPGPGAAQAILTRASNKGRQFSVDAMPNFSVTPTGALLINLPNDDVQSGITSSVTWDIDNEGDASMSIVSRGLVSIPTHSWVTIAESTWSSIPETTWATIA